VTTGPANGADRSDEDVLATFRDVDRPARDREAAFHLLVQRYHRRLFAVCVRVLGSAEDAEDAVQETFVKLARHAEGFRGDARLSTWLYRVARNVCLDRVRHDARRPSTPIDDFAAAGIEPRQEDGIDGRVDAMVVRDALAGLDERSRQLLLLVAVDGLTYAEAAEVADLPVGTVKSRVSRARVRLGQLLAPEAEAPSDAPPPGTDPPAQSGPDPTAAPRGPPDASS
jgi:RNA polymerase sigma-70 factor, ECF subfamily